MLISVAKVSLNFSESTISLTSKWKALERRFALEAPEMQTAVIEEEDFCVYLYNYSVRENFSASALFIFISLEEIFL